VSSATATSTVEVNEPRAMSPSRLAWRRLRRDKAALISGGFLIALFLAVIPGAPHMPFIEQPAETARVVGGFLREALA